jgi:hypothetical protein
VQQFFLVDSRVNLAEACFSFGLVLLPFSYGFVFLSSCGAEFFLTRFFTPEALTTRQDPVFCHQLRISAALDFLLARLVGLLLDFIRLGEFISAREPKRSVCSSRSILLWRISMCRACFPGPGFDVRSEVLNRLMFFSVL